VLLGNIKSLIPMSELGRHDHLFTGVLVPESALRLVRVGEGLYALIALLLWMGLPLPPHGTEWVASVHLLGTTILALVLVWRARVPSRRVWLAAAALAAWVLVVTLWSIGSALPAFRRAGSGAASIPILVVASLPGIAQLLVASGLYRSRALITGRGGGETTVPAS
jgi:hypothetical protein